MTSSQSLIDRALSQIILDRSLPKHIKDDYPQFVSFLESFLEWTEQSKNPLDLTKNLLNYRDVDSSLDEFIEYFQKEFLVTIPSDVLADKRLLVKHIKSFYQQKGTQNAYKFLFRILYNEDIEFYYPKVDILRASDGRWYEQKSIKTTISSLENLILLNSRQIFGETSGASAIVEFALNFMDRGENICELTLTDIRGTFQSGERIYFRYVNEDGDLTTVYETILSVYTGISITDGGGDAAVGEFFIIRDENDIELTKGIVTKVSKGPVTGLEIDSAGQGYNGDIQEVTEFWALPFDYTLNGDYLPETVADGSDSNSSGTDYTAYTFDESISTQEIEGDGDFIAIQDSAQSFGAGAFGRVSVVGNDREILEVILIAGGANYETPIPVVQSDTGSGGVLTALGGGGQIVSGKLLNFPLALESDFDSTGTSVWADFTDTGDGTAEATVLTGPLGEYPGKYLTDDGHLSSSKKLQDNFFYQDFSYVIKVGISINRWRDTLKRILHPAGFVVFGEIQIATELDYE